MYLPKSIKLSKMSTDKLRHMKSVIGVTPNVLARIAMMLSMEDGSSLKNSSVADNDGVDLKKDVLFGDHADIYEVLIRQYIYDKKIETTVSQTIVALVEAGVHKMGHVKTLSDLSRLTI
ncbi:MAG: DndE family protein [Candidatus Thiodiazotropha taylori]